MSNQCTIQCKSLITAILLRLRLFAVCNNGKYQKALKTCLRNAHAETISKWGGWTCISALKRGN